jgi:hypothetical protein
MSRRRELSRRLASLTDIAGIMSAMKGLALMEIRVLQDFLATQRRMVAASKRPPRSFFAWHAGASPCRRRRWRNCASGRLGAGLLRRLQRSRAQALGARLCRDAAEGGS